MPLVIQWFKEGRMDLIEEYGNEDVAITNDLYYFGREEEHVYYVDRGEHWRVSVDW